MCSRVLTSFVVHGIRNIRNVVACVRLPSNKDLAIMETKGIHEILPKAEKLSGHLNFVCGWRCTLLWAKTSSRWLLDPNNIGKIDPG